MIRTLSRRWGAAVSALAIGMVTWAAAPAAADTAPTRTGEPTTVSADVLPTVQIEREGVVYAQVVVGDIVYAGGKFSTARPAGAAEGVSTVTRSNLLAYNITTGQLVTSFAPVINGEVKGITKSPDGSRIYIVGSFTQVNGQWRNKIAAFDTATGQLNTSFRPQVEATTWGVAATNTTVYVGGAFTFVQSVPGGAREPRLNMAAFRASDGAVTPFRADASGATGVPSTVHALALTPVGNPDRLVVGGRFTSLSGASVQGLGSVEPATGASLAFPANSAIRNSGANAAIWSLAADADGVYGTGYHFGGGGNLEHVFRAHPGTGELVWVADCHGDTYSVFPMGGLVYTASHSHYCGNMGGYHQTEPWDFYHANAFTKEVGGVNTPDIYNYQHHAGRPAPTLLNWFPQFITGVATGQGQAPWSVAGNADYVVYGGEFQGVNGAPQQGLVRFAVTSKAPNRQGPRISGADANPVVTSTSPGTARIRFSTNWDRDNESLRYRVYRGSESSANMIFDETIRTPFWLPQTRVAKDEGRVPGSTEQYLVTATDPFGNTARSQWVSTTISGTSTGGAYSERVLDDGATSYWRLGESSGTSIADQAGSRAATRGTGVTLGGAGAIANDADTSAAFNGTSSGLVSMTTAAEHSPHTVTVEAWIKTRSTAGGKIVGFGTSRTGSSSSYDRHLYMTTSGRVNFGVYNGSTRMVTSSAALNDGAWHHVVGSFGRSGLKLYVDGALVAQRTDTPMIRSYNGYWRIGGDSTWSGAQYLNGEIDDVAIYEAELPANAVAAHHALAKAAPVPNAAPTASFTTSVSGLTVTVNGSGSSDSDGTIASYVWDLGDGRTATGATPPAHTYAAGGTYTVRLTVTDDAGATGTTTRSVTVQAPPPTNVAPTASFTSSVSDLSVTVDGSGSSDSDGTIASYAWEFGDGRTATGATPPAHTYAAAGTYTVRLTVTDNAGATGTTTRSVTVQAPPPSNVAPTASFTTAVSGLAVTVNGSGSSDSDGTIASYAWEFGDGRTATGATPPAHTYAAAGTYTVRLTVTDNAGATGTTTRSVTVQGAPATNVVAADSFTRTTTSGWGAAETGGTWSHEGGASWMTTNGSAARAVMSTGGASPRTRLGSVSVRDVEVAATLSFDKLPGAGSNYAWLSLRNSSFSTGYAARVLVNSSGTTSINLMSRVSNAETSLGSVVISGLTYTPGTTLRVRAQAVGASPTTLRFKVWRDGQPEPAAWQLERTDSTAALQGAAAVGTGNYLSGSATNAPVTAVWDDFTATALGG